MNRRKKLKQIIKRKDARGKTAQNTSKPKYVSKAERAKLALEATETVSAATVDEAR